MPKKQGHKAGEYNGRNVILKLTITMRATVGKIKRTIIAVKSVINFNGLLTSLELFYA